MMSLFGGGAPDRYAREHVAMTPLREQFEGEPRQWDSALRQLQEQLYREEFEPAAVNGRARWDDDFRAIGGGNLLSWPNNMISRFAGCG